MNAIIDSPGVQELIHQLRDEGRAAGRAEGRSEGRVEGRTEEARSLLLRQLRVRFGELPDSVTERVQTAEIGELERWAERVLTAATPEEVVADPPPS